MSAYRVHDYSDGLSHTINFTWKPEFFNDQKDSSKESAMSIFRSKASVHQTNREPDKAAKAQCWLNYAVAHPGLRYEFAFGISVAHRTIVGLFPAESEWATAHVRVFLTVFNTGGLYLGTVLVDIAVAGVGMRLTDLDLNGPQWHDGHVTPASISSYWYHPVSQNRFARVVTEATRAHGSASIYRNLVMLPGVKEQGHNCSTFAVSLAEKAGFNFWAAKILGANPVYLV